MWCSYSSIEHCTLQSAEHCDRSSPETKCIKFKNLAGRLSQVVAAECAKTAGRTSDFAPKPRQSIAPHKLQGFRVPAAASPPPNIQKAPPPVAIPFLPSAFTIAPTLQPPFYPCRETSNRDTAAPLTLARSIRGRINPSACYVKSELFCPSLISLSPFPMETNSSDQSPAFRFVFVRPLQTCHTTPNSFPCLTFAFRFCSAVLLLSSQLHLRAFHHW